MHYVPCHFWRGRILPVSWLLNPTFEAVKSDGGGHLVMYWRILLPLLAQALATSAVLEIMSSWND
ncbi:hypothetical protein [Paenibacillus pseudetheri]|uniref:hypothetical protein n=1 Tax=Paenibacillus pseudetheri TaxID=2897682 RepID=UPI001F1F800F|nr:hypothetical protein [Paenibacillus pseudetheri]